MRLHGVRFYDLFCCQRKFKIMVRYWRTLWMFGMLFCCLGSFISAANVIHTHGNNTNTTPEVKPPLWTENESCSHVHDIPNNRKCAFVRNVTACQPDGGLINYFVFTHCWMPNNLVPLSAVIMVSMWCVDSRFTEYLLSSFGCCTYSYFWELLLKISE